MNGRILYVFSTKALIYTGIGTVVGLFFYFIFSLIGLEKVGLVITIILAVISFSVATFKVPETETFAITRKTGGSNIDDVIKRKILFELKKKRVYTYAKEEEKK